MKPSYNVVRTVVFTFAALTMLVLAWLVLDEAQPTWAQLQPANPAAPALDRFDAMSVSFPDYGESNARMRRSEATGNLMPALASTPVLSPTGWDADWGHMGTFHYTWMGMVGHQWWDEVEHDGGQNTSAHIIFSYENIPDHSTMELDFRQFWHSEAEQLINHRHVSHPAEPLSPALPEQPS